MTLRHSLLRPALGLGLMAALGSALASTPASHDVVVTGTPGETIVVEWDGTALPGASGASGSCLPAGADDGHDINLTIPEGFYNGNHVTADFQVTWTPGTPAPGGLVTDPDLVLTILDGTTDLGSSDGGTPQESVGIADPASGTLTAVVCPFTASMPTDYHGKLTVKVIGAVACTVAPSKALANSLVPSASAVGGYDEGDQYRLPNFDVFLKEATATRTAPPQNSMSARRQSPIFDLDLGLPSFLWARQDAPVAAVGALAPRELLIARAREHLKNESKQLKLTAAMIADAEAYDAQYNGNGPAVVRFRQRVGGIEVYHRSLNVLLDKSGKPVATSGYFATGYDASLTPRFERSAAQAISTAWGSFGGTLPVGELLRTATKAGFDLYTTPSLGLNYVFERAPRAKAIYYPRADGSLEPAYLVELFARRRAAGGGLLAYSFVVSASDGRILNRNNLSANATAYSYRVFADVDGIHHPYDEPTGNDLIPFPFADPDAPVNATSATANLVSLISGPIKNGDPWLPDGATQTTGNHADACIDVYDLQGVPIAVPPPVNSCVEGLEPRAEVTSANTFDYPIAAFDDPSTDNAKNAAVVGMFYMVNWLHDWWYDHGFDEVSGNAQTSNYDRGGEEGDPLLAQGQDGSGRNNANMATPADGSSPVMQQYLFNGIIKGEVNVTSHPAIGSIPFNAVEYGPQTYDYTGELAIVDDGFDPTDDGCTGLSTPAGPALPVVGSPTVAVPVPTPDLNLAGKIAVIVRGGGCPGSYKARLALESGATGLLLVHNGDGPPPYLVNGDIPIDAPVQPTNNVYQLPIATIRQDDGQRIMELIKAGETVTVHMRREPTIDLDGTLDNLIIAHEYFHYVHHRLTDSGNPQANSMSEGWGDIDAFMVAARPEDRLVPGNDKYQGAYPGATYVTQSFFYGIRRAPYSTDFSKNAFTFKHISDGEPTPDGGDGSINSEVHNSGEIWANMVWECYVGILNVPGRSFDDAQSRMKDYIIGGFKMTPADATYTEARDAILGVALANDFTDYEACSKGFARRGIGLNAVSPARASTDHVGVIEDYTEFVCKVDNPGGGSGSGGTSGGGGSSSGGTAGSNGGRFGGSLNLLLLLPMLLLGLGRRRLLR